MYAIKGLSLHGLILQLTCMLCQRLKSLMFWLDIWDDKRHQKCHVQVSLPWLIHSSTLPSTRHVGAKANCSLIWVGLIIQILESAILNVQKICHRDLRICYLMIKNFLSRSRNLLLLMFRRAISLLNNKHLIFLNYLSLLYVKETIMSFECKRWCFKFWFSYKKELEYDPRIKVSHSSLVSLLISK